MRNSCTKFFSFAIVVSGFLSGCGGSIGQTSTAEGLFVGTTSTNRTTTTFVTYSGSYAMFYSAVGDPTTIAGAVMGAGTQINGVFTSISTTDVNLEGLGVSSPTLVGTYSTADFFNGTITYLAPPTVTYSGKYNPAGYQATASLTTLAGTYKGKGGTSAMVQPQTIVIGSTGTFAGQADGGGCAYAGTVFPLFKGNGYSIAFTFGGAPCAYPSTTITGTAYLDRATKRLYVGGQLSTLTDGFVFAGTLAP